MTHHRAVTALAGTTLPVLSWAVLWIGLAGVGLQQTISIGPQVLLDPYLGVTLIATAATVVEAATITYALRLPARAIGELVAWAVLATAVMSWIVAPVLIGELEIVHGLQVFIVLSVLGLMPLGIVVGGAIALTIAGRAAGNA